MINQPAKNAVLLFISLISLFCFNSCNRKTGDGNQRAEKNYSIYILGLDGKEYLVETTSLDSGIVIPEEQGALLNGEEMDRDIIVKKGYYYHLNRKKPLFTKYKIVDQSLKEVASAPLKDLYIENYYWIGGDTLLLAGMNADNATQAKYALITTDQMKVIARGDLAIPKPSGKYTSMVIGLVERRKSKLFIGYTYHQQLSASNYTTSDTTYVAELSYPQLKVLKTDRDARSTYPGGMNTIQVYSFNDEQQNYYFMTCPGIALGNRPDRPTGIFRIKAGETHIDPSYFFNISGSVIRNHAYGIWYLGGNKAIVRNERRDLFKGLSDHYSTAHFEFHVIDLLSGKVIKKLDLPLDKGTRRECIIVHGDRAYIAVNSSKYGNYIWIYNSKTGTLKKGAQLAGNTDFIMRIDDLKK